MKELLKELIESNITVEELILDVCNKKFNYISLSQEQKKEVQQEYDNYYHKLLEELQSFVNTL